MRFNASKTDHFFFGVPPSASFGSFHCPNKDEGFSRGVLLCYPVGYEYISVHRVFRQLAIKLCNNGFNVLRFDYFGSGDSSGEMEQAGLQRWIEDIILAAKQLEQRANINRICAVGLRLGASMAVLAAKELNIIDSLVLWEPLINGKDYLNELLFSQEKGGQTEINCAEGNGLAAEVQIPHEFKGFLMSPLLVNDFQKIDLMSEPVRAKNVQYLTSAITPEQERYFCSLDDGKRYLTKAVINEQKLWLEEPYKALVPTQTLNSIVSWITNLT